MPTFRPNEPVAQPDPLVTVDTATGLNVGAHRFSLVAVDDSGNQSQPTVLDVIVRDTDRPTAVLDMVDEAGRRIDPVVSAGQAFRLSGTRSSDVGGRIVEYRFALLPRP